MEGPVALKRRIITAHGLRLAVISETEWREIEDARAKKRSLKTLLAGFGDVLD